MRMTTISDLVPTRLSILRKTMFANYLTKLRQNQTVMIATFHQETALLTLAQDITITILKLRRSILSLISLINSWQLSNLAISNPNRQEVAYLPPITLQKMFASAKYIRGSPSKYENLPLVNDHPDLSNHHGRSLFYRQPFCSINLYKYTFIR